MYHILESAGLLPKVLGPATRPTAGAGTSSVIVPRLPGVMRGGPAQQVCLGSSKETVCATRCWLVSPHGTSIDNHVVLRLVSNCCAENRWRILVELAISGCLDRPCIRYIRGKSDQPSCRWGLGLALDGS